MGYRHGYLWTLCLTFSIGAVHPATASTDPAEQGSYTLEVPHLAVSSDLLSSRGEAGEAETAPMLLAQAPPGGGSPAAPPQGASIFGRAPMRQGSWEVGVLFGRMFPGPGGPSHRNLTVNKKNPKGDVRAWWLIPRIGYTFWEIPWYPGSFQAYVEPNVAYISSPTNTYLIGVNLMLRHTILVWRLFSPYIEGGAGLLNTNLRTRVLGESIQFQPQVGVGFHLNLFEQFSLDAGYRFHHISNAGLTDRNRGVNSHLPYIGFTHYF